LIGDHFAWSQTGQVGDKEHRENLTGLARHISARCPIDQRVQGRNAAMPLPMDSGPSLAFKKLQHRV
jgi:hypothetical protein